MEKEKDKMQSTRKNGKHLRVPVLHEEEAAIKQNAEAAGLTVAAYLRNVGMGYQIKGIVDNNEVEKLAKINGDLGRLGGLLKLWLTNDERAAQFGHETIHALLSKIERTQDEMGQVMMAVVMPRKKP